MKTVILNGIYFFVEYTKVYLLISYYLKKDIHRLMKVCFPITLVGVMCVSHWYSLMNQSIIFFVLIVLLFLLTLKDVKNIVFVILSYLGISLIDMVNGILVSYFLHYFDIELVLSNEWNLAINQISLILLLTGTIFYKSKSKPIRETNNYFDYLLFTLGALLVSVYLTYVILNAQEGIYNQSMFFSAVLIFVIFGVLFMIAIKVRVKNILLEIENENNKFQLELQNSYYTDLLKIDTETRKFRHDVKEHLLCLTVLAKEKNYEELLVYLAQMDEGIKNISPKVKTGNRYIDIILWDLMEKYSKVKLEWTGVLPPVKLESMDICSLFSNLLKNAFESAADTDDLVIVEIKIQKDSVYIYTCNSYSRVIKNRNDEFQTTKNGEHRGYGMKNVQSIVDKYKGIMDIETVDLRFQVKIVLPDAVE